MKENLLKRCPSGRKLSGSITVMASLTLLTVMSLVFSLVELGRVEALNSVATLSAQRATDSAFSQYNRLIWDEYGVLYFDGGYGSSSFSKGNLEGQINIFGKDTPGMNEILTLVSCESDVLGYSIATDGGGDEFISQACQKIFSIQGSASAQTEKANMESSKSAKSSNEPKSAKYPSALSKMAEAESKRDKLIEEKRREAAEARARGEDPPEVPEVKESQEVVDFKNAARQIGNIRGGGMTSLVLGSSASISGKTMKSSSPVSHRGLNSGTGEVPAQRTDYPKALEDALFAEYLKEFYSCYCNQMNDHGMSYELEYILCGNASDRDNLEETVKKLIALREAENIAAIYKDSAKQLEATALASELATALWAPELEPLFKILVIVAWAFTESVMDLRTLLDGGKVPLIKDAASWTSKLGDIGGLLSSNAKAKSTGSGITYQGYINQLIFFMSRQTKAYRAMDMIEETLLTSQLTPNARMDNMIGRAKGNIIFTAEPMFLSFVSLSDSNVDTYSFTRGFQFTYF